MFETDSNIFLFLVSSLGEGCLVGTYDPQGQNCNFTKKKSIDQRYSRSKRKKYVVTDFCYKNDLNITFTTQSLTKFNKSTSNSFYVHKFYQL